MLCAQIPLPAMPEGLEVDLLEDIANRADLSSAALPSAIFYTFVNTHQALNCVAFSSDGGLLAGGHFLCNRWMKQCCGCLLAAGKGWPPHSNLERNVNRPHACPSLWHAGVAHPGWLSRRQPRRGLCGLIGEGVRRDEGPGQEAAGAGDGCQ